MVSRLALILVPLVAAASLHAEPALPDDGPSLHAYGTINATCRQWTDSCRVCTKGDDGDIVCSTAGIACQPGAITCTTGK